MNDSHQFLLDDLKSGFIDKSLPSVGKYHPSLLINDSSRELRVLTTILAELYRCEEFWFSVAFITTSGVASIINTLEDLECRGIKGKILASQYQNFTQPEALRRLLQFSNIDLRLSVDRNFHSKGYLFKNEGVYELVIGSSNLTANALSRNVEWNLKVTATPDSRMMQETLEEFGSEFEKGISLTKSIIDQYEIAYKETKRPSDFYQFPYLEQPAKVADHSEGVEKATYPTEGLLDVDSASPEGDFQTGVIKPNRMQIEALSNLDRLRTEGRKKALLVSATGTGKTYLSAFDAQAFQAKKLLFVVHRKNIANAAIASFQKIFGNRRSLGLYSGKSREIDKDFIFCTIQTLSRQEHLHKFLPNHFDYIIIDETHRAGATTYQSILNYFIPEFLLGMTATPERTDGFDIFKLFDHTIAYEIRLHRALDEDMLSPFHYYGVTDLTVDGRTVEESSDFNLLSSDERVTRIIEKAAFYGTDSGRVRGLVFCSRVEECQSLASIFNSKDIPSLALTGDNSEEERESAIRRLESNDVNERLDYIFTVDIFNEGVDIPQANQVIMLRPTQSAIIFVQQMGRGLRKTEGKDYLTIIDFIGNYNNNYLVPIALYGDNSYNKDKLRKLMKGGSNSIPGTSTINFDRITKDRIFSAIDSAKMTKKKDLVHDYELLKFQLGRLPMMNDFLEHGSRDPFLYVQYSRSFYNFSETQEESLKGTLSEREKKVLEAFSKEVNNSVRIEESLLLKELISSGSVDLRETERFIKKKYQYSCPEAIQSAVHNLGLKFTRAKKDGQMLPLNEFHQIQTVLINGNILSSHSDLRHLLENNIFKKYLLDSTECSIRSFNQKYDRHKFYDGFLLYQKYSRKDVFRILRWKTNPVAQNVGGYIISEDNSDCPIFVTYNKADSISESTKYEDYFINNSVFAWMSKSNRNLNSSDVQTIKQYETHGLRIPLFIKKSDDEGLEFYYVGDIKPILDSFEQSTIENDNGQLLPVVKIQFNLDPPLEDSMNIYLTQE